MTMELMRTIHGSRLYNLHSENSDYDYYTVINTKRTRRAKYAKQSIVGNRDSVVVDLGTFMMLCDKGVPQALEAMFSPVAEFDRLSALRNGYRAGGRARDTYQRTIDNFLLSDDPKRHRHALRLSINLRDILWYGRFNPRLSEIQADIITDLSQNWDVDTLRTISEFIAYQPRRYK